MTSKSAYMGSTTVAAATGIDTASTINFRCYPGGGGGGHVGVHASEERPYSLEKLSMYVHVVGIRLSGGGGGGHPFH